MKRNILLVKLLIILSILVIILTMVGLFLFCEKTTNHLNFGRFAFSMIDINNDSILVIGGDGGSSKDVTKKAELINLNDNSVKLLPNTNYHHRQSLLVKNKEGNILIIDDNPIEYYNPKTKKFVSTQYCVVNTNCTKDSNRLSRTFIASPYDAENVLIMLLTKSNYQKLYLYNFDKFTLRQLPNFIIPRTKYSLVNLNNGQILITGGIDKNNKKISIAEIYNPNVGKFEVSNLDNIKSIIAKIKLSNNNLYITYNSAYLLDNKTNKVQKVNYKYDKLMELLKGKNSYQLNEDKILIYDNKKLTQNSQNILIYNLKTNTANSLNKKLYKATDKGVIHIADKVLFIGGRKNLKAVDNIVIFKF